jgi:hypothetical protein
MGAAPDASKGRLDHAGVDDVARLAATLRTMCFERMLMRWTTVFIFKLMQHTVVAAGSVQSAIPEIYAQRRAQPVQQAGSETRYSQDRGAMF